MSSDVSVDGCLLGRETAARVLSQLADRVPGPGRRGSFASVGEANGGGGRGERPGERDSSLRRFAPLRFEKEESPDMYPAERSSRSRTWTTSGVRKGYDGRTGLSCDSALNATAVPWRRCRLNLIRGGKGANERFAFSKRKADQQGRASPGRASKFGNNHRRTGELARGDRGEGRSSPPACSSELLLQPSPSLSLPSLPPLSLPLSLSLSSRHHGSLQHETPDAVSPGG